MNINCVGLYVIGFCLVCFLYYKFVIGWYSIPEPCKDVACGDHAFCKPDGNETYCICEDGWTFNPLDIGAGCIGKSTLFFKLLLTISIIKQNKLIEVITTFVYIYWF